MSYCTTSPDQWDTTSPDQWLTHLWSNELPHLWSNGLPHLLQMVYPISYKWATTSPDQWATTSLVQWATTSPTNGLSYLLQVRCHIFLPMSLLVAGFFTFYSSMFSSPPPVTPPFPPYLHLQNWGLQITSQIWNQNGFNLVDPSLGFSWLPGLGASVLYFWCSCTVRKPFRMNSLPFLD